MYIIFTMSVVNFYDRVEKCLKGIIRIMWTSVNTNSRVDIFTSREYGVSKWEVILIFLIAVCIPNITSQSLAQKGLSSWRENWESSLKNTAISQMGSSFNILTNRLGCWDRLHDLLWWIIVLVNTQRLILLKTLVKWNVSNWKFAITSLSSRAASTSSFFSWALHVSSAFHWSVTGEEWSAIKTFWLTFDDRCAFICDEFAIRPVSSLQLRENKHAFIAYFECPEPWYLLVVGILRVVVLDEIIVNIVV